MYIVQCVNCKMCNVRCTRIAYTTHLTHFTPHIPHTPQTPHTHLTHRPHSTPAHHTHRTYSTPHCAPILSTPAHSTHLTPHAPHTEHSRTLLRNMHSYYDQDGDGELSTDEIRGAVIRDHLSKLSSHCHLTGLFHGPHTEQKSLNLRQFIAAFG